MSPNHVEANIVKHSFAHQRRGNVAEGVDNNVGRFHQKCQNFRHHVRNFLWPNLRIVLEKKILPEKK